MAETATAWIVTTPKGKAFTVTVNPQTAFGTKAAPATAAQFPVGIKVRVIGRAMARPSPPPESR